MVKRNDVAAACLTTVSVWRELSTKQSDHEDNDENTDTDDFYNRHLWVILVFFLSWCLSFFFFFSFLVGFLRLQTYNRRCGVIELFRLFLY